MRMTENSSNPNLGYCDGLQTSLSPAGEVAHHLDGVRSAAKVWVDPVSACSGVDAEQETTVKGIFNRAVTKSSIQIYFHFSGSDSFIYLIVGTDGHARNRLSLDL